MDTEPKKLEWNMTHDLKMAVVRAAFVVAFADVA